jgi:hypothetical protein
MNLKQQLKKNKNLAIAFCFIILITILSAFGKNDSILAPQEAGPEIDTVIPKGYVLVPLDLENKDTISSVIQSHGIVDLYSGLPEQKNSHKIASKVKIIRAPYNPNLFAVLVKEDFSSNLMRQNEKIYAVIQNKNQQEGQNEIARINKVQKINIDYQN